MLKLDQLAEIVDTPGRMMGLFRKHDKIPGTGGHEPPDCARCALEIIAMEIGVERWTDVLQPDLAWAFAWGFDGVYSDFFGYEQAYQAYELGRRARIACGLEVVKQ